MNKKMSTFCSLNLRSLLQDLHQLLSQLFFFNLRKKNFFLEYYSVSFSYIIIIWKCMLKGLLTVFELIKCFCNVQRMKLLVKSKRKTIYHYPYKPVNDNNENMHPPVIFFNGFSFIGLISWHC